MVKIELLRNHGHPWNGRAGFNVMRAVGETQVEIEKFVQKAQKKFWAEWITGIDERTGQP